jgi:hypothetical protein
MRDLAGLAELGRYFGFKHCCVEAFCGDIMHGRSPAQTRLMQCGSGEWDGKQWRSVFAHFRLAQSKRPARMERNAWRGPRLQGQPFGVSSMNQDELDEQRATDDGMPERSHGT